MADREEQLCALGDYDPEKIDKLRRVPMIEFYMILNARIEKNKKIAAERKKK